MKVIAEKLIGEVKIPSSKSISHRAIICAALSEGISRISEVNLCDDVKRTIEGLIALGAEIEIRDEVVIVQGIKTFKDCTINCHESGSTLRFLLPLSLLANEVQLIGTPSLMKRPMNVYLDIFEEVQYNKGYLVKGELKANHYTIKGDVSSQFITGLMFSLPLLKEDSVIEVCEPFESKSYVDLTVQVLKNFGISIIESENKYIVKGNQKYQSIDFEVEIDYSALAFFTVANEIGNDVKVINQIQPSLQGDSVILELMRDKPSIIDVSDCPDLVPILAVYGALVKDTEIVNAKRLRLKESDRLNAITTELKKIGANIEEKPEGLVIKKVNQFIGGTKVSAHNDHRIAMALAIASTRANQAIDIDDIEVVKKSYPDFFEDFKRLGGIVNE